MTNTLTCPILRPLVPMFWISGDVSSGFQHDSGFCLISFCRGKCNVLSLRSTSWESALCIAVPLLIYLDVEQPLFPSVMSVSIHGCARKVHLFPMQKRGIFTYYLLPNENACVWWDPSELMDLSNRQLSLSKVSFRKFYLEILRCNGKCFTAKCTGRRKRDSW